MKFVDQHFLEATIWKFTCEHTLERNHIVVNYVGQHFQWFLVWKPTCKPTLKRNDILVKCVDQHFHTILFKNTHENTYWSETIFCEWWDSAFSVGSSLKTQMQTDIGKKPISCELCGSTFSVGFSLKRQPHWREKAFSCEICGSAFTTSSHWKEIIFLLIERLIYVMTRGYAVVFIIIFSSCYCWNFLLFAHSCTECEWIISQYFDT